MISKTVFLLLAFSVLVALVASKKNGTAKNDTSPEARRDKLLSLGMKKVYADKVFDYYKKIEIRMALIEKEIELVTNETEKERQELVKSMPADQLDITDKID
ncbi:unnamed protein product [Caenorhabditis brenneri]